MLTFDLVELADAADWFASALQYPSRQSAMPPANAVIKHLLVDAESLWERRAGSDYCGLFDIGSPEPAAPLQEGFYHSDPHTRLRRVTNFYRYFEATHYAQWAPDHLCVELTFLAYLFRLGATHASREDLRHASREFARLHPGSFVNSLAQRVMKADTSGVYATLVSALVSFLGLAGAEQRILAVQS